MSSRNRQSFDSDFGSILGSYESVEELLQRIREGDQEASTILYDHYVRRLIALVQSKLSPIYATRFDAESVVQSAMGSFFVRMRKGDFDFRNSGKLWHLLAAIAMNKLRQRKRDETRKKRDVRREERHDFTLFGSVHGIPLEELAVEPPDDDVQVLRDGVEQVLTDYTARQRHIITLSLQGYSIREIAEKAVTSESNARRVLKDFKEDLMDRLKSSTGGGKAVGR